jgi:8-oxo-dGTP pyrophosphatase MutT (NUDIX family)
MALVRSRGRERVEAIVKIAAPADLASRLDLAFAVRCVEAADDPAGVRDQILEFAAAHPDALHRTCVEGHLTGSGVVVDAARERVALLLHAKVQRWLQPGGHADGEANLARVAWHEVLEETGLRDVAVVLPAVDLDVHLFVRADGLEPPHWHLDVRFLMLAPPGAELARNDESHDLAWVDGRDLDRLDTDPSTRRLVRIGLDAAKAVAQTS